MTKRAFVLLSGGMDSTTCLYLAKEQYDEVEAISVHYGQKHSKEISFAQKSCQKLNVNHSLLDVGRVLGGEVVMLTDPDTPIPDIDYADIEGVSPTYVPFRNGTLLSVIAAQAQKWVMQEVEHVKKIHGFESQTALEFLRDASAVFFGAHAEDAHNWAYPDCTPEFIGAMANAIHTGTYYTVRLNAPLMSMTKAEIVTRGTALGVNWKDTWSCYAGDELHCGTCPTCRARKQAFKDAQVLDPTEYAA